MKPEDAVLINGHTANAANAVSALDRGLHYGDGVFRTLKIQAGEIRWWEDHYQKLMSDCAALHLKCPDEAVLKQEVLQLAAQEGVGIVKIVITRGQGQRGYAATGDMQPMRVIMAFPAPFERPRDVAVRWCDLRLSAQPRLAGIKHLNRLENVLARSEWNAPEIAEGLLMDEAGRLIGGTMSNLFLREGESLVTPLLDRCGIAGVARTRMLRAATRHGTVVRVEEISRARLLAADEAFLTNSLIEVWRIANLEHHVWRDSGLVTKLVNWLNEEN